MPSAFLVPVGQKRAKCGCLWFLTCYQPLRYTVVEHCRTHANRGA